MKGLFTGKGLKHFTEPPPRNAGELATLSGTDIAKNIERAEQAPKNPEVKTSPKQDELMDKLGNLEKPKAKDKEKDSVDVREGTRIQPIVHLSNIKPKANTEISPLIENYMKQIDTLLNEIEVKLKDPDNTSQDRTLINVEKTALTSIKDFLKKADLSSETGNELFVAKLSETLKKASKERTAGNNV